MLLLPISHRQQLQQADCLAACAAMVLDYLQIPMEYRKLLKLLRIGPRGTPYSNLRYLESLGLSVLIERGELTTLHAHLESGLPPIALVYTEQLPYWDETAAHAVVIVGIEGDRIYLNDPAFPDAPKVISTDEFELAWIDFERFYALIRLE